MTKAKPPIVLGPGQIVGITNSRVVGRVLNAVSVLGHNPWNRVVPSAVVAGWLAAGRRREAAWQVAGWAGALVSPLIKRLVARRRPPAPLWRGPAKPTGGSFPSSHTLTNTAFYATAAYMAARNGGPLPVRATVVGAATASVVLTGPARLYAREHWLSDVVAGYVLGSAIAIAIAVAYERDLRGTQGKRRSAAEFVRVT